MEVPEVIIPQIPVQDQEIINLGEDSQEESIDDDEPEMVIQKL